MPVEVTSTPQPSKLLNHVRDRLRMKHHSIRTETKYVQWVLCFGMLRGVASVYLLDAI